VPGKPEAFEGWKLHWRSSERSRDLRDLTTQIARSTEAIKTLQGKRALLPLPHERGFDLDEDERLLAAIEALQAFVRVMVKTLTDPLYHPQRQDLERLRAWALAEKSLSSPTYTDRRAYVQENRKTWQEIASVLAFLLAEPVH
jgi:hypothetical protein